MTDLPPSPPEPLDARRILQSQLKALDAKLAKVEPRWRAAREAYDAERRAAEQRLMELAAMYRKVNDLYAQIRSEREQVFRALGVL